MTVVDAVSILVYAGYTSFTKSCKSVRRVPRSLRVDHQVENRAVVLLCSNQAMGISIHLFRLKIHSVNKTDHKNYLYLVSTGSAFTILFVGTSTRSTDLIQL